MMQIKEIIHASLKAGSCYDIDRSEKKRYRFGTAGERPVDAGRKEEGYTWQIGKGSSKGAV